MHCIPFHGRLHCPVTASCNHGAIKFYVADNYLVARCILPILLPSNVDGLQCNHCGMWVLWFCDQCLPWHTNSTPERHSRSVHSNTPGQATHPWNSTSCTFYTATEHPRYVFWSTCNDACSCTMIPPPAITIPFGHEITKCNGFIYVQPKPNMQAPFYIIMHGKLVGLFSQW